MSDLQKRVTARIAAIRAVMEKATPGKWEAEDEGEGMSPEMRWGVRAIALAHNITKSNLDFIEAANKIEVFSMEIETALRYWLKGTEGMVP